MNKENEMPNLTLENIAKACEGTYVGDEELLSSVITGAVTDSRKVEPGYLFIPIRGERVDGHSFIPQAKENGAVAIITEKDGVVPEGMSVLKVADLKKALHVLVPFFHDYPARRMRIIGITGTNGKTSISYMLRAMLRRMGLRVGLIGTIQVMVEDEVLPIHNTTPDVVDLQKMMAYMLEKNMDYVVMEVSSHALDQNRVAGVEFDTVVFTNLTQDHLDYHHNFLNYDYLLL